MDDIGNRSSFVSTPYQDSPTTTSYTTNSMNEYTAVGAASRTHDDNGNLTDDGTNEYAYDWRNHLITVTRKADSYVLGQYYYDALGRRMRKDTEGLSVSSRHLYDGIHVVEERDGNGDLLKKFAYGQGVDEVLWMEAPDQADVDEDQNTTELMRFHYHANSLGSVTHLTGPDEDVVEQYEHTPYGEPTILDGSRFGLSSSAVGNPSLFAARRLDEETGLYHCRARAYDANAGRFLQADPLDYACGMNTHEYALSSPSVFTDPLGLAPVTDPTGPRFHDHGGRSSAQEEAAKVRHGTRDEAMAAATRRLIESAELFGAIEFGTHIKNEGNGRWSWDGNIQLGTDSSVATLANALDISLHTHPGRGTPVPSGGDLRNLQGERRTGTVVLRRSWYDVRKYFIVFYHHRKSPQQASEDGNVALGAALNADGDGPDSGSDEDDREDENEENPVVDRQVAEDAGTEEAADLLRDRGYTVKTGIVSG